MLGAISVCVYVCVCVCVCVCVGGGGYPDALWFCLPVSSERAHFRRLVVYLYDTHGTELGTQLIHIKQTTQDATYILNWNRDASRPSTSLSTWGWLVLFMPSVNITYGITFWILAPLSADVAVRPDGNPCGTCGTQTGKMTDFLRVIFLSYIIALLVHLRTKGICNF
jgi:hypothetical protein